MYHYFVSYIIKFNNGNIGYGDTEITQGYPIVTMEDILKIKKVLLKGNDSVNVGKTGKEIVILNYKLLYKEKQKNMRKMR